MKDLHHHEESKCVIHTVNISDQRMANKKKMNQCGVEQINQ